MDELSCGLLTRLVTEQLVEHGWLICVTRRDVASGFDAPPHDAVHGGYDNTAALQDPNRVVPLDALRELERAGVIGKLLDDVFVTVGNIGSLNAMKRIGAEIAATLVQRGVQAVVLPAT